IFLLTFGYRLSPGLNCHSFIGLTATASSKIIDDVKAMLGIGGALVFRSTFNRPNLFYEVRPKRATSVAFLVDLVLLCRQLFADQSGIIYCFSSKEYEKLAHELKQRVIKVKSLFLLHFFFMFPCKADNRLHAFFKKIIRKIRNSHI